MRADVSRRAVTENQALGAIPGPDFFCEDRPVVPRRAVERYFPTATQGDQDGGDHITR
jgi:hypothetical protein